MGCGQSIDAEAAQQNKASAAIDAELRRARQEEGKTVKCLMLGAGESGKSTLVKQMRLMYANPYTDRERAEYAEVVYANAVQSMQAVIRGFEVVRIQIPAHLVQTAEYLASVSTDEAVDLNTGDIVPHIRDAIVALWAEPATKEVVRNSAQFQLNDSARYFFDEMDRVGQPGYTPTDQDILRTRVRSTGIVEETFDVRGQKLRVFDVGGQRSERKKWIHCFENVNVLVFVAAISEYDLVLYEDETVNRLAEAAMLWESIAGSRWFGSSAFVLMLNKIDLFADKILGAGPPLIDYFPDYTGPPRDLDAAKSYMKAKFVALNPRKERGLYVHLTCATDTNQARVVLAAVMDQVLTRLLSEVGLM
ncbi:heterotrimeric G protein alpha subunit B [Rhodotorula diobovata]|uniref:Heterotrimeric G protein alpha subunit B n=1 Tax=Rhodotorula diobovata TaxID=5288 RepID=A0A5C5FX63_9BASI|nr:heterotrimeric G protein alpha subunit B [Rhodotorula diobovata]